MALNKLWERMFSNTFEVLLSYKYAKWLWSCLAPSEPKLGNFQIKFMIDLCQKQNKPTKEERRREKVAGKYAKWKISARRRHLSKLAARSAKEGRWGPEEIRAQAIYWPRLTDDATMATTKAAKIMCSQAGRKIATTTFDWLLRLKCFDLGLGSKLGRGARERDKDRETRWTATTAVASWRQQMALTWWLNVESTSTTSPRPPPLDKVVECSEWSYRRSIFDYCNLMCSLFCLSALAALMSRTVHVGIAIGSSPGRWLNVYARQPANEFWAIWCCRRRRSWQAVGRDISK